VNISDVITEFINELMRRQGGTVELRRGELAGRFNCVPSQINYVMDTRFTPEHGYIVETRRGGGGYIRITRVSCGAALIMHTLNAVGDEIDGGSARVFIANLVNENALGRDAAGIILAAVSDGALRNVHPGNKNAVRAAILKACLLANT